MNNANTNVGLELMRRIPNLIRQPFSRRVLVVGCDGVEMWGAVFEKKSNALSMLAHGSVSVLIDKQQLSTLLGVLKDQLKQQGLGALPAKAMLSTVDVSSMTMEMPIDTVAPDSGADPQANGENEALQELFRWEMEPVHSQRQSLWSLGNIFVAFQWMDRSQLQGLIASQLQQKEYGDQSESIGELAIQNAFIAEHQVEEALVFQRRIRQSDEDISCTWVAVPKSVRRSGVVFSDQQDSEFEAPGEAVEDETQQDQRWLAGAVCDQHRRAWRKRFSDQGVELVSMHPMVGLNSSCVSEANGRHFLLELYSGLVGCSEFEQGRLKSLRLDHGLDRDYADQCLTLLEGIEFNETTSIELRGNLAQLPEVAMHIANELQQSLEVSRCNVIEEDTLLIEEHARFSSLAAIARCALGLPDQAVLLAYSTLPVRELAMHRIGFWWSSVASVLVLAVVLVEGVNYVQLSAVSAEGSEAKASIKAKESIIEKVSHTNDEVDGIMAQLEEVKDRLQVQHKKRVLFLENVMKRQEFIDNLLPMLSVSLPKDSLLDRVIEKDGGISVQGWSVSDASAQRFVTQLAEPLSKYNLVTTNESITSQDGPFGKPGQRVSFELSDFDQVLNENAFGAL